MPPKKRVPTKYITYDQTNQPSNAATMPPIRPPMIRFGRPAMAPPIAAPMPAATDEMMTTVNAWLGDKPADFSAVDRLTLPRLYTYDYQTLPGDGTAILVLTAAIKAA